MINYGIKFIVPDALAMKNDNDMASSGSSSSCGLDSDFQVTVSGFWTSLEEGCSTFES